MHQEKKPAQDLPNSSPSSSSKTPLKQTNVLNAYLVHPDSLLDPSPSSASNSLLDDIFATSSQGDDLFQQLFQEFPTPPKTHTTPSAPSSSSFVEPPPPVSFPLDSSPTLATPSPQRSLLVAPPHEDPASNPKSTRANLAFQHNPINPLDLMLTPASLPQAAPNAAPKPPPALLQSLTSPTTKSTPSSVPNLLHTSVIQIPKSPHEALVPLESLLPTEDLDRTLSRSGSSDSHGSADLPVVSLPDADARSYFTPSSSPALVAVGPASSEAEPFFLASDPSRTFPSTNTLPIPPAMMPLPPSPLAFLPSSPGTPPPPASAQKQSSSQSFFSATVLDTSSRDFASSLHPTTPPLPSHLSTPSAFPPSSTVVQEREDSFSPPASLAEPDDELHFEPPASSLSPSFSPPRSSSSGSSSSSPLFQSSPALVSSQSSLGFRSTVLPKVKLKEGQTLPNLSTENRQRYESLRLLGEGGVGEVNLVKDNDINRLVAMKRLKREQQAKGPLIRFVEEIQTIGQLEHPNIVPIHDVGVDENGQYYFVMKYVQGETLEEIIRKLNQGDKEAHQKYTFHARVQIFLEILKAIHFAHARGFVHRDIKPANVIVGQYGEVMVMDWGLAKRIRDIEGQPASVSDIFQQMEMPAPSSPSSSPDRIFQTRVGAILGTPAYMSPEQAFGRNDEVDERSDIYSLSALFYEFLTLRHYLPFKKTMDEMLLAVTIESPAIPSTIKNPHQPVIPVDLNSILLKGLQKDPKCRYSSVSELARVIQFEHIEGHNSIGCAFTLAKRSGREMINFFDRHPFLGTLLFYTGIGGFLLSSLMGVALGLPALYRLFFT